MIRHTIDGEEFMALILDDPGNIFFNLSTSRISNEIVPILDAKNYLDMNLSVGVCHNFICRSYGTLVIYWLNIPAAHAAGPVPHFP